MVKTSCSPEDYPKFGVLPKEIVSEKIKEHFTARQIEFAMNSIVKGLSGQTWAILSTLSATET